MADKAKEDEMNLYRRVMEVARNTYGWAIVAAIHIAVLIFIGFLLNLIGIGGINYIITVILIPVLVGLFLAPEITVNLMAAAVASGILLPASVEDEVKKYFTTYLDYVRGTILWLSLVFIFLGTIPIRKSPLSFFALLSILMLIAVAVSYWDIKGAWARRLTYYGLIFLAILTIGKFVPDSFYIKAIGTNPSLFFDTSKEEKQADELNKILEALKENPNNEEALDNLEKIQEDMRSGSLLGLLVGSSKSDQLAKKNAKTLEKIDALREIQQQNQLAEINGVAAAWQIANPGKDFPAEIKRAMVAVKEGLTLEEFEAKLKAEADAKAKAEEEAKKAEADAKAKKEETEKLAENKAEKLAKETSAPKEALTTPRVIKIEVEKNGYSWKTIPAGNYKLEPRTVRVKTNINDRSEESNGLLSLSQDTLVYFYPPMGLEISHVLLTKN